MAWSTVEDLGHGEVRDQSDSGNNEHDQWIIDLIFVNNSYGGFIEKNDGQTPNQENGAQCSNDLSSQVTKSEASGGWLGTQPNGDHGDDEAKEIGEHMSGITQDSQ